MPVQTGCCKLFYSSMWPMLWEGGWEWTVPFCRLDINLTPHPHPHPHHPSLPWLGWLACCALPWLGLAWACLACLALAWSSNNNRPPSAAGGGCAAAVVVVVAVAVAVAVAVVAGQGQGKAGKTLRQAQARKAQQASQPSQGRQDLSSVESGPRLPSEKSGQVAAAAMVAAAALVGGRSFGVNTGTPKNLNKKSLYKKSRSRRADCAKNFSFEK